MTFSLNRRAFATGMLMSLAIPLSAPALAQQNYPTGPVKLIVPFGAGGLNDTTARLWADKVSPHLGQPIIVENRPGGGGLIGTVEVANAKPDGYTLLLGSSTTQVIVPLAAETKRYDPIKDFQAVSLFAVATAVIAVHPSIPANNIEELIAYIRSKPGELSYGSAGVGSNSHLAGEMFKNTVGDLDLVHAPYNSGNGALQDLIAGHIPIATPHITSQIIEFHKEGKIRILAVAAAERLASAPDIPTGIEAGLSDWIAQTFNGIIAPAGVPAEIVAKVAAASALSLEDEDFVNLLTASGYQALPGVDGERAQAYIAAEVGRLEPVIKATGFKLK